VDGKSGGETSRLARYSHDVDVHPVLAAVYLRCLEGRMNENEVTLQAVLDFILREKNDYDLSREIGGQSVGRYGVEIEMLENDALQVILRYDAGYGADVYHWSTNMTFEAFQQMV
jgi:hypothetical protein